MFRKTTKTFAANYVTFKHFAATLLYYYAQYS